jgi:hypothetical protein
MSKTITTIKEYIEDYKQAIEITNKDKNPNQNLIRLFQKEIENRKNGNSR